MLKTGGVVVVNGQVWVILAAVEPARGILYFFAYLRQDLHSPLPILLLAGLEEFLIVESADIFDILGGDFSLSVGGGTLCLGKAMGMERELIW